MDAATLDSRPATARPAAPAPADTAEGTKAASRRTAFNHGDTFGFSDLLDILNPLQHIPIVNAIYRRVTGDSEGTSSDLIGGAVWGNVVGLAAAAGDQALENDTGKTSGDHLISFFVGDDDATTGTAMAAVDPPKAAASAVSPPAPVISEALPTASVAPTVATAGNYLVFGGNTAPPSTAKSAPDPSATMSSATGSSANLGEGSVTSIGDMMVFGAAAPAPLTSAPVTTATLSPVSLLPASAPPASATTVAAAAPTALTAAASGPTTPQSAATSQSAAAAPARTYPAAFRRGPSSPTTIMPMPTTGPAALPGHTHSMATGTSATTPDATTIPAVSSSPADPTQELNDQSWFVAQFNAAMDKYQKAARLGGSSDGVAATVSN